MSGVYECLVGLRLCKHKEFFPDPQSIGRKFFGRRGPEGVRGDPRAWRTAPGRPVGGGWEKRVAGPAAGRRVVGLPDAVPDDSVGERADGCGGPYNKPKSARRGSGPGCGSGSGVAARRGRTGRAAVVAGRRREPEAGEGEKRRFENQCVVGSRGTTDKKNGRGSCIFRKRCLNLPEQ